MKELHQLAKQEDPTRPTTAASNQEGSLNSITDVIAWNRYDGWYDGMPVNLGVWLDKTHKENPSYCIAVSEYGAGASVYHQQEALEKTLPTGWFHPENWQTYYHIENWKVISQRPYLWASFVWNMFDFGAAHRTEGDRPGINDKGLVTFDRKTKKDAYFFYKANWNKKEPLLYIAGRRIKNRKNRSQTIVAFTNQPHAILFVNGVEIGTADTDVYSMVSWHNVELKDGVNCIEVRSGKNKNAISDRMIINKI